MASPIDPLGYAGMDFFNILVSSVAMSLKLIAGFLIGYLIAVVISTVLNKILNLGELKHSVVRHGAMSSKLWASSTTFLTSYVKWYITVAILTVFNITIIHEVFLFLTNLLSFIILFIIGLGLGGVVFKIIKDALESLGLGVELKKHNIAGAFGGFELSSILAGIVKWYIVLLFIGQGIAKLNLVKLSMFVDELMVYIPNAILGLLILIVALLLSNLSAGRIRSRKTPISDVFALGVEVVIVFFGVVIALPKFGVHNVSILEDSFKILSIGVSLGLGIAIGLGLKEPISKLGEKYRKEI